MQDKGLYKSKSKEFLESLITSGKIKQRMQEEL
jgi:hypothetical protein